MLVNDYSKCLANDFCKLGSFDSLWHAVTITLLLQHSMTQRSFITLRFYCIVTLCGYNYSSFLSTEKCFWIPQHKRSTRHVFVSACSVLYQKNRKWTQKSYCFWDEYRICNVYSIIYRTIIGKFFN